MAGFFDTYVQAPTGSAFVGKEEKEEMIASAYPFPILKVVKGQTQYGERYIITTEIEGEERSLGFGAGTVFSRDRLLDNVAEWLEAGNPPPTVVMKRIKRSIVLENPNAEAE